jgi:hypothetical protein
MSGPWGFSSPTTQQAVQYWLANKVGADFIAMDGGTEIASKCTNSITTGYSCAGGNIVSVDPVTSSEKYAAVDAWVKTQTNLPIWWMESHIQPEPGTSTQWTDAQAAAARIATEILMNSSGATVGMQWNPQDKSDWADEGLWTDTGTPSGGQITTLGSTLLATLPQLNQQLALVSGQPTGIIVATNASDVILVNTNTSPGDAIYNGKPVLLSSGQVMVQVKNFNTVVPPTTKPTAPNTSTGQTTQSNNSRTNSANSPTSLSDVYNPSGITGLNYQNNSQDAVFSFSTQSVVKVEYYLNNTLLKTVTKSPFIYKLDKTHVLNGIYTYKVVIFYSNGTSKTASTRLKISNSFSFTQVGLIVKAYDAQLILTLVFVSLLVFGLIKRKVLEAAILKHKQRSQQSVDKASVDQPQYSTSPTIISPSHNSSDPEENKVSNDSHRD